MQRPGWNPRRRNRNIGTAKQGHGQDNRMVIPDTWRDSRTFWERVSRFGVVTRPVHGRNLPFVVETTRPDCVYACTVEDLARLLGAAPAEHVAGIEGVLLRQPKRKEQLLSPVWDRLGYAVDSKDTVGKRPGWLCDPARSRSQLGGFRKKAGPASPSPLPCTRGRGGKECGPAFSRIPP